MPNKLSIQDYYYRQRKISETYGIDDNHAGCYICKFPSDLCMRCKHREKCVFINEEEKLKGNR